MTGAHDQKVAGIRRDLKAKTGCDIEAWLARLDQDGLMTHRNALIGSKPKGSAISRRGSW